jgi:hypothetical protein
MCNVLRIWAAHGRERKAYRLLVGKPVGSGDLEEFCSDGEKI